MVESEVLDMRLSFNLLLAAPFGKFILNFRAVQEYAISWIGIQMI